MEGAGLLVVRGGLPCNLAHACRRDVEERHTRALVSNDAFAEIHDPTMRSELMLELVGSVRPAVVAVLHRCRGTLTQTVGSDAELCELSAISSEPGSLMQREHSDT